MDSIKTGSLIRNLRRNAGMTQSELANRLGVSDRAVSKWECGKGMPDISVISAIAAVFGVGSQQLLDGNLNQNEKSSGNPAKLKLYYCPQCGGIYTALGDGEINCCGYSLSPLEATDADAQHDCTVTKVEDEYFIEWNHPMTKRHYISFAAVVFDDSYRIIKLYPEQSPSIRVKRGGSGRLYFYCSQHGLMKGRL